MSERRVAFRSPAASPHAANDAAASDRRPRRIGGDPRGPAAEAAARQAKRKRRRGSQAQLLEAGGSDSSTGHGAHALPPVPPVGEGIGAWAVEEEDVEEEEESQELTESPSALRRYASAPSLPACGSVLDASQLPSEPAPSAGRAPPPAQTAAPTAPPPPATTPQLSPRREESAAPEDVQLEYESDDEEVLRRHRVKRFVPASELNRSKVDPALEAQLMALLQAGRIYDKGTGAMALLRQHVASQRLLLTCDSLSAAVQCGDFRLVKAMLLYPFVDFSTRARMPVTEAVLKGDVRITRILLLGPVSDVNKGCPLARAVDANNLELVQALVSSDRINPNKGGALYRAVAGGNPAILDAVLSHKRLNVNKFCGGWGTTALCRAIDQRAIPLMHKLLAHPKIDINRGFLLTPLQHAVDTADPDVVAALMSARTPTPIDVNKHLGGTRAPLQMAIEARAADPPCGPSASSGLDPQLCIIRLLLADPHCEVTPEIRQVIEREDMVDVEQAIVYSNRLLFLGDVWRRRIMFMAADAFATALAAAVSVAVVGQWAHYDFTVQAAVTGALLALSCVTLFFFLQQKAPRPYRGYLCLRLAPTLYELQTCCSAMGAVLGSRAPRKRAQLYLTLGLNCRTSAMVSSGPQFVLQLLFAAVTHDVPGDALRLALASAVLHALCLLRLIWQRSEQLPSCASPFRRVPRDNTQVDAGRTVESTRSQTTEQPAGSAYAQQLAAQPEPVTAVRKASVLSVCTETSESSELQRSGSRRRRPPQLDLAVVGASQRAIGVPPRCLAAEERERQQRQKQQQQEQAQQPAPDKGVSEPAV